MTSQSVSQSAGQPQNGPFYPHRWNKSDAASAKERTYCDFGPLGLRLRKRLLRCDWRRPAAPAAGGRRASSCMTSPRLFCNKPIATRMPPATATNTASGDTAKHGGGASRRAAARATWVLSGGGGEGGRSEHGGGRKWLCAECMVGPLSVVAVSCMAIESGRVCKTSKGG